MIVLEKYRPDWEYKRLQFGALILNSSVDKKIVENEIPVKLCNYVDVYKNDIITESLDFMDGSATQEEINKFSICAGDVIITKDSESPDDIGIPAFVEKNLNGVVCGYHLAILKPFENKLNGRFLSFFLNSRIAQTNFELGSNGVTRFGLSRNAIKTLQIPIPKYEEQTLIARYLDQKTGQIDRLIEQKEKLLKLLAEKRTAIITQAVTKGLDPTVEMKDSGIDWLGMVPAHWEVKRLRFLIKTNPVKSEINLPENEIVSFIPMEAVHEYGGISIEIEKELRDVYNGYTYFRNDDVIVAKITPCFENGKGAIASGLKNNIAFGTTELHVLRPKNEIDYEFLFYVTISDLFRKIGESWMYGAGGQKRVPELFIKNYMIQVCEISEQKEIVTWLNKRVKQIHTVSQQIIKSINSLKEYREALITAAVTGQIDVRKEITDE